MACIVKDPGNRKRVQFIAPNGDKRTVRLGKIELRHAESVRVKVESIVSALSTRQPLDKPTAEWVGSIDDVLHARMAAVGLLPPRQGRGLQNWLDSFMTSRAGLKPESRRKLEQTKAKLIEYFGAGCGLHEITPERASQWREKLKKQGLSEAATKTHVGNAKTMFREAVTREVIEKSPFAHLKGGVTPTSNTRYVTREETEKLIGEAPDTEWALLIGLARYAGLRTPSETHLLRWADVDWARARLRVRSPKTERFQGHETRLVPIVPRLAELLHERFHVVPEGDEFLITIKGAGGRRRKMVAIMERAGVEAWDDTWQTLRRSCEIEWAQVHPQYIVSKWIGHSIAISGRHYANAIPEEAFDRAAGKVPAQQATPNPTQHAAE